MAPQSHKKRKEARPEKSAPVARFEIVRDEAATSLGETWANLRRQLAPLLEAGRIALGDAYSSVAQVVLEKKEDLEDQRAEQKALKRNAARRTQKAAAPLLLEAGSLKEPRKSSSKNS